MRGLRTFLDEFRQSGATNAEEYDVIVLTETNLYSGIKDSELGLLNFDIYHCDRFPELFDIDGGGGVLIAVKDSYTSSKCLYEEGLAEQLFLEVKVADTRFIIGGTYIRPSSCMDYYSSHLATVEKLLCDLFDHQPVLLGD